MANIRPTAAAICSPRPGVPLDGPTMHLLRLEYLAELAQLTRQRQTLSVRRRCWGCSPRCLGCAEFIFSPAAGRCFRACAGLPRCWALCVVTVALCKMAGDEAWMTSNEAWLEAGDAWRAELIPLLLFAMTVAIAYHQELALLLSAAMSLVVVLGLGQGLAGICHAAQRVGDGHFPAGPNSHPQQVDLCRPLLRSRRAC